MCHINTPSARFRWLGSWEEHTLLTGITYQHLPRNQNASEFIDAMGNYDDVETGKYHSSHSTQFEIASVSASHCITLPMDKLGVWFSFLSPSLTHIWVWIF